MTSIRICLILVLAASTVRIAAADSVSDKIQPLLERYCYRCHGPTLQTAGIDYSRYKNSDDLLRERQIWVRVLRVLREREMPPAEPLPTEEERQQLAAWIDDAINNLDWEKHKNPGHVTIPRLNHLEYDNTVRDLTGLDLRLAESFPPDGAGETGFTNDRDGLFLPPLLMEKYFEAADRIVNELIAVRENAAPFEQKIEVEDMLITETNVPKRPYGYDVWVSQNTIYEYVRFPRFGRYEFAVRAWGQSENEGDMPGVTLRVGGRIAGQQPVLASPDDPGWHHFFVNVPAGSHRVSLHWYKAHTRLTNPVSERLREDRRRREEEARARGEELERNGKAVLLSLDSLEIRSAFLPEQDGSLIFSAWPGAELSPEAAAEEILQRFASRAYRRPVEADELRELLALYGRAAERGEPFERAIGLALKAVLVSPKFLFRVEQGDAPERDYRLNDDELASRLSYFLWMSMPDEELFRLARQGRLREPETLVAQVRRMIADPKSRAFSEIFASQWLGIDALGRSVNPDTTIFPEFNSALREAMKQETALFFDALVREDQSLLKLLDANFTFANEQLASHYGLIGVTGPEYRWVPLIDRRRGGVLGMGAVLTATSLPVRTSPVVRGKWVLETLLGEELPPPPPDAGELPEPSPATENLTLRQRFEMHREAKQCATCHDRIDPIGYGLENFDAVGRWREQDNGRPVDALGVLPTGEQFRGPVDLKRILLSREENFARTISKKMMEFALGRQAQFYDTPVIEKIAATLAEKKFRPSVLLSEIVNSYPFQYQRSPRAGEETE